MLLNLLYEGYAIRKGLCQKDKPLQGFRFGEAYDKHSCKERRGVDRA
jgi:hypothetical protein